MNKLLAAVLYFTAIPLYKLWLTITGDRRRSLERNDGPSYWIPD